MSKALGACRVVAAIPAYNAERTLERAVRSLARQQGVTARAIVVDHGSTDATSAIAARLERSGLCEHRRIERLPGARRSASAPLNAAFREVVDRADAPSSTWLLRLDADDYLASDDVLARQLHECRWRRLALGQLVFVRSRGRAALYRPQAAYRTASG